MQDLASPKVKGLEHYAARIASSLLMLLANNAYSWAHQTTSVNDIY
jgi:hypothetical protein